MGSGAACRCMGCAERWMQKPEFTAFLCLLRKAIGPTMEQDDNKEIMDGLWKGEMRCIGPRAKGAALWIIHLGIIRLFALKRNMDRGRACRSAPHQEGHAANVALRKVHRGRQ